MSDNVYVWILDRPEKPCRVLVGRLINQFEPRIENRVVDRGKSVGRVVHVLAHVGFEIVEDKQEAVFGPGFPMPQIAIYAGWYQFNVTGALARPTIEFMPESWHLRMTTIESAHEDTSFQGRVQAWLFAMNVAESRPLVGAGFAGTEDTAVFNSYYRDPAVGPVIGHAAHSIYFQVLGDHGPIGLMLYLAMLATTWMYTATIRRRTRHDPKLEWAHDLAAMMQVSLLAFMVAGAALSMAYYDIIFLLTGMSIALRQMVLQSEIQERPKSISRPIGSAQPVPASE